MTLLILLQIVLCKTILLKSHTQFTVAQSYCLHSCQSTLDCHCVLMVYCVLKIIHLNYVKEGTFGYWNCTGEHGRGVTFMNDPDAPFNEEFSERDQFIFFLL